MKRVGQLYRESLVKQIREGVDRNANLFVLSYSQISGNQISDLRKNLREAGAYVYVSKNSIAQRALQDLKHDELVEKVAGQTAFIWSNTDSSEVSKILIKFAKEFEDVTVRGGLLSGRILEKEDVKKLSDLPSKEVLLSILLSTIQAPLTRLAGALNAKSRDLLSILKQLSEKKGGK